MYLQVKLNAELFVDSIMRTYFGSRENAGSLLFLSTFASFILLICALAIPSWLYQEVSKGRKVVGLFDACLGAKCDDTWYDNEYIQEGAPPDPRLIENGVPELVMVAIILYFLCIPFILSTCYYWYNGTKRILFCLVAPTLFSTVAFACATAYFTWLMYHSSSLGLDFNYGAAFYSGLVSLFLMYASLIGFIILFFKDRNDYRNGNNQHIQNAEGEYKESILEQARMPLDDNAIED